MGVLQRFERRLGGLVEGAFAKVFKGGVEPVEIASALARETDDRRASSSNRVLVPNEFAVELAGGDFARLAPYTRALCDELAEMVREHAAEQRYTFVGPVTVRLAEADDLDIGVFRIRSSVASADPGVVGGRRPRPRPAAPGTPHLLITTRAPGGSGGEREYPLDAETTVIGRSVECDIRLNDTGVSRRHGEIRRLPDGQFLYVDAGSTNGSLVNGRAATQVKLVNGDRIELGTAVVEFRREESRAGTGPRRTAPPDVRGAPPPGRRSSPPPGDPRTPPPFDHLQPTPPSRRGPVPPPADRYGRADDPYARPEPGGPGPRDRGGRGPRDDDYREGPSARFRDDPAPRPVPRDDDYRDDDYRDDDYREGPAARFRDDGHPPRGRGGPTPAPDARRDRERPTPGAGRDGAYRGDVRDRRDAREGRPGGDDFREQPRRGGPRAGGHADMYHSPTDPRSRAAGGRTDDGLDALEPLDDVYGSETRLPSRASERSGGDDRRRRDW